jgi:hypothetical protein
MTSVLPLCMDAQRRCHIARPNHASGCAGFCRTQDHASALVSRQIFDARPCANDYVYVHGDPVNTTDLTGMTQSCSSANDATGFGGAGLATLIRHSDGKYQLQITLFDHFLAQFSAITVSTGYSVTYKVNGHAARGRFAGDAKIRPAYDDIHTRQLVQGRRWRKAAFWRRKRHTVRSGDTLYLNIRIDYFDPVSNREFSVRGSLTCRV